MGRVRLELRSVGAGRPARRVPQAERCQEGC